MIDEMALVGSVPEDAVHKYSIRPGSPLRPVLCSSIGDMAPSVRVLNLIAVMCESILVGKLACPTLTFL
jgi:hypothetical protein